MSGMTMSMVTRSGRSCLYFSTACSPVSASPTISKPACCRMSPTIVRMKMASSQIRTEWLTITPGCYAGGTSPIPGRQRQCGSRPTARRPRPLPSDIPRTNPSCSASASAGSIDDATRAGRRAARRRPDPPLSTPWSTRTIEPRSTSTARPPSRIPRSRTVTIDPRRLISPTANERRARQSRRPPVRDDLPDRGQLTRARSARSGEHEQARGIGRVAQGVECSTLRRIFLIPGDARGVQGRVSRRLGRSPILKYHPPSKSGGRPLQTALRHQPATSRGHLAAATAGPSAPP